MSISHCVFDYHRFGTSALDTKANQIVNGIYNNPVLFATPTVTQVAFVSIQHDFNLAAADYTTYGLVKKTAFTNARKKIIDVIDLLADYVDGIANGDVSLIVLSGFTPSNTSATSNIAITKIESFLVKRTSNEGEIAIEIPAILGHGSVNYFCICSEGEPLILPPMLDGQFTLEKPLNKVRFDFTKSRKKIFKGLAIASTYYFYVFASNTVSVSPVSDVKSLMAA